MIKDIQISVTNHNGERLVRYRYDDVDAFMRLPHAVSDSDCYSDALDEICAAIQELGMTLIKPLDKVENMFKSMGVINRLPKDPAQRRKMLEKVEPMDMRQRIQAFRALGAVVPPDDEAA